MASVLVPARLRGQTVDDDAVIARMDSLVAQIEYKLRYGPRYDTAQLNKYKFAPDEVPTYHASVYEKRLREMRFVVPVQYNEVVRGYIDAYTKRYRRLSSKLLGLEQVYLPIIEEVFEREGLPDELKYLAHIESALNPYAVSPAQAVGLWQFIASTGKMYGLRIDSYVDERRDPYKSTVAAAKYLKDLYATFNDWLLAIAAYNSGPGRVMRAVKTMGSTDFWKIRAYLPRETAGYVPAFIGAAYTMKYHAEHNLYPIYVDFTFKQDEFLVSEVEAPLAKIAELSGASLDLLKQLNPELIRDAVPYSSSPYKLRMPETAALKLAELVREHKSLAALLKTHDQEQEKALAEAGVPEVGMKKSVFHTVQTGENLERICLIYGVRAEDVVAWNDLVNQWEIYPGQSLKLYVPYTEKEIAEMRAQRTPKSQTPAPKPAPYVEPQNHRVQYGDSLWTIAQRHGVTVEHLCRLNCISRNQTLYPGQVLRVR
ncbi:MAG: transglycosylase SLT domain-containing protein [Bacteroidia bacterium]|nr:transglycosylase SLT domain-containing protein [Bacteroidia bacterium]MDW8334293.1 transglycosylase SLT domain-containing protein [Bacteroidia bacterium]